MICKQGQENKAAQHWHYRDVPHTARRWHQYGVLLWCLTINFWKKVIIKPPDEHQLDDTTSARSADMCYSCLQQVNFYESPLLWCDYSCLMVNPLSQQAKNKFCFHKQYNLWEGNVKSVDHFLRVIFSLKTSQNRLHRVFPHQEVRVLFDTDEKTTGLRCRGGKT